MKAKESENKKKNTAQLKKEAQSLGIDLFGVADISDLKKYFLQLDRKVLDDCRYGISLGVRLLKPVMDDIHDHPTPLYLHHYRQINYLLDRAALTIARMIQQQGFQALPIAASQVIDWEGQKGHVSHKAIAIAAGHGWIGRNNLLVHPLYGSQVRLVTVLTDYPLVSNGPDKGSCGNCTLCIAVCPAHAIREDRTEFDHRVCFEKLRSFKNAGNIGHYICGICIRACSGPVDQAQASKSRQEKNSIALKNSKRED